MDANTESARAKKMYVSYVLLVVCLCDWIYKLLQILINFDLSSIIYFLSNILHLWQTNTIATTTIIVICALGIPKFLSSLRKSVKIFTRLVKSLIKTPIILNVPVIVYVLVIIFKFSLISSKFFSIDHQCSSQPTTEISYWQQIRQSFVIYRYLTSATVLLFLLGIYNAITNRMTYRLSKVVLRIFAKQTKIIQTFLSMSIPTPVSFLSLILLNTTIQIFPKLSMGVYGFFTNRSVICGVILGYCLYRIYQWFWPNSAFNIDFTGDIHLNDVSRLNETRVYSLFYPRTINDIQYLISKAKSEGRTISLRGQAHTMGGQTLPARKSPTRNYVCDLKYLNRVKYDKSTTDVFVEAGATWTHVIRKLNFFGRSPVVMQSYCTFSAAGTISVNAHGITSDDAIYTAVINIEYVDMNGKIGECNREQNSELFSLMIGGYGLFGIITRLRLKTVPNVKTSLEYIRLQSDQFSSYYEDFMKDSTIEIKIARVDLVRPNNILMFVFRQESGTLGTVADLSDEARVMHPQQHLIYTYLAQHRLFRRIRFALEKIVARPLDLVYSTDRNTTMYESAKPMALLYQPLVYYDDTFVLQEYFVPKQFFDQWYNQLKVMLAQKFEHVFLLNLTIRFVKKDETTFLAYTKEHDCFAFVFYFRIKRNRLGDEEVRKIHQQLIRLTFEWQGTFYLPYRQHYSFEQIKQAYPMVENFFEKKTHYDSIGLFSNDWYEHFRPKKESVARSTSSANTIELITEPFQIVEQRRMHSFAKVIQDERLREKFRKFLRTVFNAEPVHVIFNYVNRAVRNSANENDHDVYRELQKSLETRQFAFLRGSFALFKQARQLRLQIKDMLRQQITIFKHLGCCGKIKDIVSFGDGGRCLNELRQILKAPHGRTYVVNVQERWTDILERNSLFPVGTFLPYDFSNITDVPIPGESIDLVVCYMGLHHLPQDQLKTYLKMIHRILRPNGLFLFREHHAHEQLKPLLDVAHMVFNAVTRVDYESEVQEIRAFRTIEQWRSCLREVGFEDTFVYDEQEDDPTDDIMIVFRKTSQKAEINSTTTDIKEIIEKEDFSKIIATPESNYFRACEWLVVRIALHFAQYIHHTPFFLFPYMKFLGIYWSLFRAETNLAIGRFGWKKAIIGCPGFLMDTVIAILLSGSFLQLSFFSFLIRFLGGVRAEPEYEQLILEKVDDNDEEFDFQQLIDQHIDDVQKLTRKGIYAIRVPRHRPFTSILKKLAVSQMKFHLLSISSLTDHIQIELIIDNNDAQRLLWLKQRSNMIIIFEYQNPTNLEQTCLYVQVEIKHLLSFLSDCAQHEKSLTVVQVFDYYE